MATSNRCGGEITLDAGRREPFGFCTLKQVMKFFTNKLCLGGGTVYTAVLEAVPERVASSNLARGTNIARFVYRLGHQVFILGRAVQLRYRAPQTITQ